MDWWAKNQLDWFHTIPCIGHVLNSRIWIRSRIHIGGWSYIEISHSSFRQKWGPLSNFCLCVIIGKHVGVFVLSFTCYKIYELARQFSIMKGRLNCVTLSILGSGLHGVRVKLCSIGNGPDQFETWHVVGVCLARMYIERILETCHGIEPSIKKIRPHSVVELLN